MYNQKNQKKQKKQKKLLNHNHIFIINTINSFYNIKVNQDYKMENFATPNNTLGMTEPPPIDTDVPDGFVLDKGLSGYIKKKKNKKLIYYLKK